MDKIKEALDHIIERKQIRTGFQPKNVIFEITERNVILDMQGFLSTIDYYRSQDYKIETLIGLGIQYGQGYYIQKPSSQVKEIKASKNMKICSS